MQGLKNTLVPIALLAQIQYKDKSSLYETFLRHKLQQGAESSSGIERMTLSCQQERAGQDNCVVGRQVQVRPWALISCWCIASTRANAIFMQFSSRTSKFVCVCLVISWHQTSVLLPTLEERSS